MNAHSIPAFDASPLLGPDPARDAVRLREALEVHGLALLVLPEDLRRLAETTLDLAAAFFRRPVSEKSHVALEHSPHHRGWSMMHNERDWREQVHLGRERPALTGGHAWRQLQGPNLWPPDADGGFRTALLDHLETCLSLGAGLLRSLAPACGIPPSAVDVRDGYGLLKLIAYHPQDGEGPARRGVAAHVDFSLLTLVAQDGEGGLEARLPGGAWIPVPCVPGTLVIHVGEVLEALSGGRLRATPHRVTYLGRTGPRLSLPVFLNPPLEAWIHPRPAPPRAPEADHIHRVLLGTEGPFHFGEAEWRRKGLNRWCAVCCDDDRAATLEAESPWPSPVPRP